jgi:transposase
VSTLDHTFKPDGTVRRLEVISGTGRRRRFSADDKVQVVEETLAPGAVVSEVARRHGLTPQQVFTWRRQLRQVAEGAEPQAPVFVPAVIEASVREHPRERKKPRGRRDSGDAVGIIEVEIDGVTVRVGRGAEAKTVAAVLRALKGGV